MHRLSLGFIFTACCLSVFLIADVSLALRCSSRVMSIGDPREKVRHFCGEPTHIESWTEKSVYGYYGHDDDSEWRRYRYPEEELIRIERWTYNFGSTQFIRYLRFENGTLKKIEIGEYGY
jgi:Protein of unknown function (DUF2845)